MPPGARLVERFLTEANGARLLDAIDASPWRADLKRRVQHYGWRYDYRARQVAEEMRLGPPPSWLESVIAAVGDESEFGRTPDQAIVNEYAPGQGISAHVDCPSCFGPAIASLSLAGQAEMIFRHRRSGEIVSVILPPLSLLVLAGEARSDWTHEIPARKSDMIDGTRTPRARRVSLTFRTVSLERAVAAPDSRGAL